MDKRLRDFGMVDGYWVSRVNRSDAMDASDRLSRFISLKPDGCSNGLEVGPPLDFAGLEYL